jgi:hypothetical protein
MKRKRQGGDESQPSGVDVLLILANDIATNADVREAHPERAQSAERFRDLLWDGFVQPGGDKPNQVAEAPPSEAEWIVGKIVLAAAKSAFDRRDEQLLTEAVRLV